MSPSIKPSSFFISSMGWLCYSFERLLSTDPTREPPGFQSRESPSVVNLSERSSSIIPQVLKSDRSLRVGPLTTKSFASSSAVSLASFASDSMSRGLAYSRAHFVNSMKFSLKFGCLRPGSRRSLQSAPPRVTYLKFKVHHFGRGFFSSFSGWWQAVDSWRREV